jgi:hypothetical protein
MSGSRRTYRWVLLLAVITLAGLGSCRPGSALRPLQPSSAAQATGGAITTVTGAAQEGAPAQDSARPNLLALAVVKPTENRGEVRIEAAVTNGGGGKITAPFTIRWYPYQTSGEIGCSWEVQAEAINRGPVSVGCDYTYQMTGKISWRLVIDAQNGIAETTKADNVVRGSVEIQASEEDILALKAPRNCLWKTTQIPGTVRLEWEFPFDMDVDGFVVYLGRTDEVQRLGADQRLALVPRLEPGKNYHFDVRSLSDGVESQADACQVDVYLDE